MQPATEAVPTYEAPRLVEIGLVEELTKEDFCFFGKTYGSPDYFNRIPITNCSS